MTMITLLAEVTVSLSRCSDRRRPIRHAGLALPFLVATAFHYKPCRAQAVGVVGGPAAAPMQILSPSSRTAETSQGSTVAGTWVGQNTNPGDPVSVRWDEEFDLQQDVKGNVTGTRKSVAEAAPNHFVIWSIVGTYSSGTFVYADQSLIRMGATPPYYCMDQGQLTLSAAGTSLTGTWRASGCSGGDTALSLQTAPLVELYRQDLTDVWASASPQSGVFGLSVSPIVGDDVAGTELDSGETLSDNPLGFQLTDPINGVGTPTPGGLGQVAATFTPAPNGAAVSSTLNVPAFGMSCYDTTLETDWGTPPSSCGSTTIKHHTYTGTVVNPGKLTGTFCAAFIAQVALQGSGMLATGQPVQRIHGVIQQVSEIHTRDGSVPVAGSTLAVDPATIVDRTAFTLDGFGSNLIAEDSGGGILGYRLDIYEGVGSRVCAGFENPIPVAACSPASPACPGE